MPTRVVAYVRGIAEELLTTLRAHAAELSRAADAALSSARDHAGTAPTSLGTVLTQLEHLIEERIAALAAAEATDARTAVALRALSDALGGAVQVLAGLARLAGRPELIAGLKARVERASWVAEVPDSEPPSTGEHEVGSYPEREDTLAETPRGKRKSR